MDTEKKKTHEKKPRHQSNRIDCYQLTNSYWLKRNKHCVNNYSTIFTESEVNDFLKHNCQVLPNSVVNLFCC